MAGKEPAGKDAAPTAAPADAARARSQNTQLIKTIVDLEAQLAVQFSWKNHEARKRVCIVIFLAAFC